MEIGPYFQLNSANNFTANRSVVILVPRAHYPSGLRQESRALGATISGMRHRCRCAVSRITRIRLFPLFFHNGCSQSSRFLPQARRIVGSGDENDLLLIQITVRVRVSKGDFCLRVRGKVKHFFYFATFVNALRERAVFGSAEFNNRTFERESFFNKSSVSHLKHVTAKSNSK